MSGVELFLMIFNTTPDTQWFLYEVTLLTHIILLFWYEVCIFLLLLIVKPDTQWS